MNSAGIIIFIIILGMVLIGKLTVRKYD